MDQHVVSAGYSGLHIQIQIQKVLCPNLDSPGQVGVHETTSSFSQMVKALVKP